MVVDRTPAYWTLTALIVVAYIVSVVFLQALFRVLTGWESQLAVVASTLAIAVLLNSPRRRIQSFVDRRSQLRNLERRSDMPQAQVTMDVRKVNDKVSVIDVKGDLTAFAEGVLMQAYNQASDGSVRAIILNFEGLEYMNSSGIGLLVTLLIRVNREKQRLLTYGLSEHYRNIFQITRLDDAIGIYDSEEEAVRAGAA